MSNAQARARVRPLPCFPPLERREPFRRHAPLVRRLEVSSKRLLFAAPGQARQQRPDAVLFNSLAAQAQTERRHEVPNGERDAGSQGRREVAVESEEEAQIDEIEETPELRLQARLVNQRRNGVLTRGIGRLRVSFVRRARRATRHTARVLITQRRLRVSAAPFVNTRRVVAFIAGQFLRCDLTNFAPRRPMSRGITRAFDPDNDAPRIVVRSFRHTRSVRRPDRFRLRLLQPLSLARTLRLFNLKRSLKPHTPRNCRLHGRRLRVSRWRAVGASRVGLPARDRVGKRRRAHKRRRAQQHQADADQTALPAPEDFAA